MERWEVAAIDARLNRRRNGKKRTNGTEELADRHAFGEEYDKQVGTVDTDWRMKEAVEEIQRLTGLQTVDNV